MLALSRKGTYCVMLLLIYFCLSAYAETEVSGRALVIQNSQTGFHTELPIDGLNKLTIKFFHSYDRQWVEESFRIDNGRFVPSEVTFKDDSYDYRHQRYRCRQIFERQQSRLLDIEPLPSDNLQIIITRVAYTRSQQLILDNSSGRVSYAFTEWGQPGQRLVFSVKK